MSVFRSFSKVISQTTLNSKNHTYLLNSQNVIQNPVLYYLAQNSPPKDINELSLVTYHIIRKNEIGRTLLNQLESEPNLGATPLTSAYQNLIRTSEDNDKTAQEYVHRLGHLLKTGAGTLPIHHAVQALYAFEATNKGDSALYEEHLLPIIREKIAYASLNNLVDLANILSTSRNVNDKDLWSNIVKHLEAKFDRPSPKYVKYSGFDLDAYEVDNAKAVQQKFSTEVQRHLTELRSGGKFTGNLKHEVRVVYDWVKSTFLYRFLFNEGRVSQTLDNFEEVVDREKLRASLEAARGAGVNVGSLLERVGK